MLILIKGLLNIIFMFEYSNPITVTLPAILAYSQLAKRITIAKLYHFDSESEGDALLRRK